VNHEFHSLSLSTLDVTRRGTHDALWKPKRPGIELTPIEGAPPPARSAAQRLVQMRTLAREFSAATRDTQDKRWELRLLSQPLYRYESTDPDVLDGALFAFVTSAGQGRDDPSDPREDRRSRNRAAQVSARARLSHAATALSLPCDRSSFPQLDAKPGRLAIGSKKNGKNSRFRASFEGFDPNMYKSAAQNFHP